MPLGYEQAGLADTGDMWPTAKPAATANDDFKNVLLFDITFFLYSAS